MLALSLTASSGAKFVVALNKVDRLNGWKAMPRASFRTAYEQQTPAAQQLFMERFRKVGALLRILATSSADLFDCLT